MPQSKADAGKSSPQTPVRAVVLPSSFPTRHQLAQSVVQIYTESCDFDYQNGWRDPKPNSCTGSGFVIAHAGKNFIVTNAHVAENATYLKARLGNKHKPFVAERLSICYQNDLALLKVDHPTFNLQAKAATIGDMAKLDQEILVVGFPTGGSQICMTKGIISRIEVDTYTMSNEDLLLQQVDAAINSGNSGGPAFSGGEIVGVAFQGDDNSDSQNIGYIIPSPVLKQFLRQALAGIVQPSCPTLPIRIEPLENPAIRHYYNMGEHTGVRIQSIDPLSDAAKKLQVDDILLAIDGLTMSNLGSVSIPSVGDCIHFNHITQSKCVGEQAVLTVLRKDATTGNTQTISIAVTLDSIFGSTKKVPATEHDKIPTFCIYSGITFMPLTRNYLELEDNDLDEQYDKESGYKLADIPKKNPGDQIVIISAMLGSDASDGYEEHIDAIVKTVNGRAINNIHDLIAAMELNPGKDHAIELASGSKMILRNMPQKELARILQRSFISRAHSEDLAVVIAHHRQAAQADAAMQAATATMAATANDKKRPARGPKGRFIKKSAQPSLFDKKASAARKRPKPQSPAASDIAVTGALNTSTTRR